MEAKESSIKEIKIVKYNEKHRMAWDDFIKNSKNGVFLFYRDYMEYHADRFTDFSLMFFDNNRLIAVMPANVKDDILFSHGGLTFGGIVTDRKMKT
ncbi:MAG: GNAT family N-acetyltransferase, partial [Candidatus Bathyarchaeia archaeon]